MDGNSSKDEKPSQTRWKWGTGVTAVLSLIGTMIIGGIEKFGKEEVAEFLKLSVPHRRPVVEKPANPEPLPATAPPTTGSLPPPKPQPSPRQRCIEAQNSALIENNEKLEAARIALDNCKSAYKTPRGWLWTEAGMDEHCKSSQQTMMHLIAVGKSIETRCAHFK